MKKVYLFAVMLFGISVMNAFPMFYSNYKLVSVTPEGTIVGDRSYENRTLGIDFDDFIGSFPLFSLKNTSGTSLSIMWDLCAFVDASGRSQNVIGTGVSFAERDKQVASTVVIPGDCVYEVMIPSESIESKWIITDSIPKKADQTISLILTVEQQEIQTRYVFSFESVMSDSGVLVESGSFTMGDENEDLWEGCSPAHEVTLTYDFYIGKDEVTFDEYHLFCEDTEKDKPYDTNEIWEIGSLPVVGVSWWDAIAYCNWLSDKEALHRAYDDNGHLLDIDGTITTDPSKVVGYRLPTEAEWEYAARGGSKSKGYKYAGSDNANAVAWYEANSDEMIHKVGLQDPNELRLYDMSGNVWEWCSDTWYEYSNEAELNPYNYLEDNISYRIVRGGSLYSEEVFLRNSSRNYGTPDESYSDTGFRICRTAPYEGENRAPFRPYATSPLNNAISQRTTTILSWDCDDPDGDDIKYDIYFDKNPNPTTLVATDYSDRTFVRSNLSHSTTYYWKIVAKDSKGATTEGPICSFITHEELSSYIPSKTVPDMILVEKGVFVMGIEPIVDGYYYDSFAHSVTLAYDFWLGEYEVTFDQYDYFCEEMGKIRPDDSNMGRGQRPVINVNWWDAAAYCNWLSEREGLPKAYDNDGNFLDLSGNLTFDITKVVGYRLPTEAEWEYAARGGENHSPYRFSGSDNVDDVAWYKENSGGSTHEVGMKLPNTLGIYDMSGNVSEWCSDGYDSFFYGRTYESTRPYSRFSIYRQVIRGGGFSSSTWYLWVARRSYNPPANMYNYLGFRICRTAPYEGENRAPFRPYATSPLNNAISQRTTTILSWDCDDPDGDDIKYDIYFDKNPNPTTLVATDYSDRTFVRSNLSHSTTYYWKIVAKDSKGATTEGPICSFITHEELSSYIPSKTVPDMILVEKGVFVMGDTWGDGCDDEKPTHKVTLTYDFEIGKYEVTLDEYNDFCEAAGRSKPSEFGWGVGRKPVQDADWWDAAAYCNWLSEREGLPKAYDNDGNFLDLSGNLTFDTTKVVGYRLPTEAEWEYAARGGENHSPYRFSGSDNVDDVAWYKENSGGSTHEVGMKLPNTLGIYDMSGNVSEWCSDTWESDYYGRSPEINPYNRSCCFMVMRGGNYLISADYMSSVASRSCNPPNEGYEASGFRICRTMP